ncbi:Hemin transport system permease protein HmuU [bacterium HR15]|nr:Hemin transport system permease protein HmuU [bacterium HR15]
MVGSAAIRSNWVVMFSHLFRLPEMSDSSGSKPMDTRRATLLLGIGLFIAVVLSVVAALSIGAIPLAPAQLFRLLFGISTDITLHTILWELRLPRVLLALLVGGALGMTGAAFQGLLRNPLTDPYVVGVSSGAAVGAALAYLLGWHLKGYGLGVSLLAFVSGLGVLSMVITLSRTNGQLHLTSFLLMGVAVSVSLWGVVTLLLLLAGEDMARVLYWLLGGLLNADWQRVMGATPLMVLGGIALMTQARGLNLYAIDEEIALHLGVPVERLKWTVLLAGALMTAAAVAVAGIIGFVGWLVPHLLRRLAGGDHRVLLPLSALGGGLLLLWADTVARTLTRPAELPVGVITALIGTPLFIWVLRHYRQAVV